MLDGQFNQRSQIAAIHFTKHESLTKAHLAVIYHSVDGSVMYQLQIGCWASLFACEFVAGPIRQSQG